LHPSRVAKLSMSFMWLTGMSALAGGR